MSPGSSGTSFVTRRPVAILMVFLAAVVFGYLSLGRLPLTLMPELTYPTVTVRTEYPGAAPEEVENDISRPVEEAVGVIAGLRKLSSISRAGISDVVLEFAWDTDMSEATQDVLEKLDLVFLPDEAKRPLLLHYDPSLDPMMELSLSGEGARFEGEAGLRRLRRLAELQIKKELEPVKGVAAVRVRGGLEEELHVLLEEEALRQSGVSIRQVIDRLSQENINVAGGTLKEGRVEYLVRTLNEFENLDQIADTVVLRVGEREIRVRDLGRVERSHKEREIVTRTDGHPSVQIEVFKEGDANIVSLARSIREAVGTDDDPAAAAVAVADGDGDGPEGPRGLAARIRRNENAHLSIVADRSQFIESSIREVRNTAVLGGLLAVLVLYLFLRNFKSTAIIAVSIPISLLVAFAPLNLLGVSLNIMSLGGLALGVGMLVDSSIVVLESIYRCREEGDGIATSAERGTREVRAAVLASTLTSIAVFFPMVFVEGIAGQAFGDLGLAVVVSLLASVAVALFFIPMLASRHYPKLRGRGPLALFRGDPSRARGRWFVPRSWTCVRQDFLGLSFRRRVLVIATVVPLVYLLLRLVVGTLFEGIGWVLMMIFRLALAAVIVVAVVLARMFGLLFALPLRITRAVMDALGRAYPAVLRSALARPAWVLLIVVGCLWLTWQVVRSMDSELLPEVHQGEFTVEVALPVGTPLEATEEIVRPIERAILDQSGDIESLILTVGYDSTNSQRSDEGEHTARFKVVLERHHRGAAAEQAVIARLRDRFAGIPDLESRIVRPVLFSSKTPIEVEVHGEDLGRLRDTGERARELMAALPGLADVELSLQSGAPEVQIVYNRDRLARYGLNIREVAGLVRDKVKGYEATRFNMKDRRIPIVVQLDLDDRETLDDIRGMIINPGADRPIRLASVADVRPGEGPSEVRRIDSGRVALISANIASGSLSEATGAIRERLRTGIDWPSDMTFLISGQNEEWQRSQKSLWIALALSIFLVYVIMAAQFESLLHPLVIMLTIPLAFVGTVVTLQLLGMSLSVVVFLGMIMLAGIVVNNAIVLVDYINQLRRRGMPRDEAIVTAGGVRLRPILMTTATTVLGLLPMALGFGDGAEIRTPMAIAVISGLLSSTALTLIVIPSVYAMADDLRRRLVGAGETSVTAESGAGVLAGGDSEVVTP